MGHAMHVLVVLCKKILLRYAAQYKKIIIVHSHLQHLLHQLNPFVSHSHMQPVVKAHSSIVNRNCKCRHSTNLKKLYICLNIQQKSCQSFWIDSNFLFMRRSCCPIVVKLQPTKTWCILCPTSINQELPGKVNRLSIWNMLQLHKGLRLKIYFKLKYRIYKSKNCIHYSVGSCIHFLYMSQKSDSS